MEVWAASKERYRASASEKRLYGGSTITIFWCGKKEDKDNPAKWITINGVGATPSERKKYAIAKAVEFFSKYVWARPKNTLGSYAWVLPIDIKR